MAVYVLGDSHGHYLFARAEGAVAHCLPGHTMHRVGRDGLDLFLTPIDPTEADDLIFVFGEIDVRQHLVRVAGEKGWSYEGVAAELAGRYVGAVRDAMARYPSPPRVTLLGIVPPFDQPRGAEVKPPHGALRDRLVIWYLLNEALRAGARAAGFRFVPIPRLYHARDGSLKRRYSDGFAHIAKDCTGPVVRAVEAGLGVDLSFRPLPRRRHLVRSILRRIALRTDDWRALWHLGESTVDA